MDTLIKARDQFFILLLFCFSQITFSANLTPYEIEYEAEIHGYDITAVRTLSVLDNGKYHIHQKASTFLMSMTESSEFSITDQPSIISHDYHFQQKILGHNQRYEIDFSKGAKNARYIEGKQTLDFSSDQIIYSPLSYQEEIRHRLLGSGKANLSFEIIDDDRKRFYSFSYKGEEVLETPLGKINCVKIERYQEKKQKRTIIWLGKDFEYSLMKIEHFKQGKLKYRMDINKGSLNGKAIKGL